MCLFLLINLSSDATVHNRSRCFQGVAALLNGIHEAPEGPER